MTGYPKLTGACREFLSELGSEPGDWWTLRKSYGVNRTKGLEGEHCFPKQTVDGLTEMADTYLSSGALVEAALLAEVEHSLRNDADHQNHVELFANGTPRDKLLSGGILILQNPLGRIGVLTRLVDVLANDKNHNDLRRRAIDSLVEILLALLSKVDADLEFATSHPLRSYKKVPKGMRVTLFESASLLVRFENGLKGQFIRVVELLRGILKADTVDLMRITAAIGLSKLANGTKEHRSMMLEALVLGLVDSSGKTRSSCKWGLQGVSMLNDKESFDGVLRQASDELLRRVTKKQVAGLRSLLSVLQRLNFEQRTADQHKRMLKFNTRLLQILGKHTSFDRGVKNSLVYQSLEMVTRQLGLEDSEWLTKSMLDEFRKELKQLSLCVQHYPPSQNVRALLHSRMYAKYKLGCHGGPYLDWTIANATKSYRNYRARNHKVLISALKRGFKHDPKLDNVRIFLNNIFSVTIAAGPEYLRRAERAWEYGRAEREEVLDMEPDRFLDHLMRSRVNS